MLSRIFFGGSAGWESTALQLGGSLGNSIGRLLRLDEKDKNIMIMCGILLVGDQRYNGAGMSIIEHCFEGNVRPEASLMKMIFTVLTIGASYKGGKIVASFFAGVAFGCLFGKVIGFSLSLCAVIGVTGAFCGEINCPITLLLISFELFGYFGLYDSPKTMYSKYKTNYINKKTQ